jgi:DNA-binding NtrC family response regulator
MWLTWQKQALKPSPKLVQTAYNLLLIDIRLPDMEGTELLTKVHETVPKIRKIMSQVIPRFKMLFSSINNGADGYLVKPFDVDKMLEIIQNSLNCSARSMFQRRTCG